MSGNFSIINFASPLTGTKPSDITNDPSLSISNKILFINEYIIFDIFTNLYGVADAEAKTLTINWDNVSKNFPGIGVDHSNLHNRITTAYFHGAGYPSWLGEIGDCFYCFDIQQVEKRTTPVSKSSQSSEPRESRESPESSDSSIESSNSESDDDVPPSKPTERYFNVIDAKTGKSFGRFIGQTPKQAASNAYTKMLQKLKGSGQIITDSSIVYLRESTRGSTRKIYGYKASRQKLPEPQELTITDKVTGQQKIITYNYRNQIKKVPVPKGLKDVGVNSVANKEKNQNNDSCESSNE